jgi:molybdopterin molybdotransferase
MLWKMHPRKESIMITYQEALEKISSSVTEIESESISISDSLGMVVVEDIISAENSPPFKNSAMDGFAVKTSTLSGTTIFDVVGSTVAGDLPDAGKNGAWEIMTGAPVPDGYDAVIKIEDVEILERNNDDRPSKISTKVIAEPNQNIREAGEDFKSGDLVLNAGDTITPYHIMALASLGITEIKTTVKPTISIISTGKELVDDLSATLIAGQIRNSNAPYLQAELSSMGIKHSYAGTIHDDPELFEEMLVKLLESNTNIIISTGAVSMGRHDFIPDSLKKLGAEIIFHKVAIRPGKPILFAKFPNGKFYFGLPGNPISAAIGLRFFVYPLICKLQNLKTRKPLIAKLSETTKKKTGFLFFRKALAYSDETGQLHVDILQGQESFKINPLLTANCWAILPADSSSVAAGSNIDIIPLTPNQWHLTGTDAHDRTDTDYRATA